MAWKFEVDRPIYIQIMDTMKCRIVSGYYQPGAQVEAVRILAAEAAVNPNTMQKALSELEREGWMICNRTNGRYVIDDRDKISELRSTLAEDEWNKLIKQLDKLGMDNSGIQGFVKKKLNTLQ